MSRRQPAVDRLLAEVLAWPTSLSVAPRGVSALANDRGKLWAANGDTLVAAYGWDPPTRFTLQRDANRNPQITDLALVGGHLWIAEADGDVLRYSVDPPERVLQGQLIAREGPSAIAAEPTGVFVASRSTETVTWFDPSTGHAKARIAHQAKRSPVLATCARASAL